MTLTFFLHFLFLAKYPSLNFQKNVYIYQVATFILLIGKIVVALFWVYHHNTNALLTYLLKSRNRVLKIRFNYFFKKLLKSRVAIMYIVLFTNLFQFGMIETVVGTILDVFPQQQSRYKELILICITSILFLLSTPFAMNVSSSPFAMKVRSTSLICM